MPRQRETKCRQEKPTGRLRQSEVFFPLAIVAHHVVPPGIRPGLIQNHPDRVFDRGAIVLFKIFKKDDKEVYVYVCVVSVSECSRVVSESIV